MTTPLQVVLSILKDGGRAVTQSGEGYAARCPAHNDRSPSLSVSEGDDGRVLLHCHAGCEAGAVVAALGLTMADLYPPRDGHATGNGRTRPTGSRAPTPRRFVATYPYHDASGELLYEVVRYEPKDFRPRRPDPAARDGWAYSYGDTPRVLYRLPDILTADHGSLVFVPEGEKDADRICREGLVATTTPGGANGAGKVDLSPLAGRDVVLLPDHDAAGEGYAADLHRRLAELDPPARVRVLRLPGLREKGDVSGWMDAALEHDGEALLRLAEVCPVTQPDAAGETVGDQSARSAHCAGDEGEAWREPTPLHVRPDLPTLPLADMFPPGLEPIRDFIAAVAEARQVPPELPAMLVPPVACVAAAGKVMFERVNGHREPPALWSLVLLGSGNRKSGTFADLLAPVMRWQRDETTRLGPIIARQHEGRKVDEARLTRLRADAAKAKPDEAARMREEAVALAAHMAEEELDVVPQLVAGDATPEAAGELLMRNRERLLLAAPEADALDVMLGRYNRGQANFGLFQAGHAGDAFSDVRRGRAGTRLERPALSVALTVQPEAVAELFGNRQASGRGLLARFLTVAPPFAQGLPRHRPATRARPPAGRMVPRDRAAAGCGPAGRAAGHRTGCRGRGVVPGLPAVAGAGAAAGRLAVRADRGVGGEAGGRGGAAGTDAARAAMGADGSAGADHRRRHHAGGAGVAAVPAGA